MRLASGLPTTASAVDSQNDTQAVSLPSQRARHGPAAPAARMWSAAKGGGPAARAHFRLKRARQRITDAHALLLRAKGSCLEDRIEVPASDDGQVSGVARSSLLQVAEAVA